MLICTHINAIGNTMKHYNLLSLGLSSKLFGLKLAPERHQRESEIWLSIKERKIDTVIRIIRDKP